ncbi:hypothetical protein IW262DRAFT_1300081 [Armillaria fumosa]|nr:hypothetical protein IW262DRAFT_1300081 [Armillaria fumosa]
MTTSTGILFLILFLVLPFYSHFFGPDWLSDLVTISRYVKKKGPCLLSIMFKYRLQGQMTTSEEGYLGQTIAAVADARFVNPASRYIRMRTFFDVYNGDDLGLSIGTTRILRNKIVHAPFNDFGWEYTR